MPVFHVHADLHRSDVRQAVASEVSRLGEVRPILVPGSGIWLLSTEEPEEHVDRMLRRFLEPNDRLAILRLRPDHLDIPGIDYEWVNQRL
jgi:hypothetical protein